MSDCGLCKLLFGLWDVILYYGSRAVGLWITGLCGQTLAGRALQQVRQQLGTLLINVQQVVAAQNPAQAQCCKCIIQ